MSLSNYAAPPSVDVKGVNDGDDGSKDSTEKIQQQQLVLVEPKLWLFLPPSKAELVFARKSRRKQRVAKGWLPSFLGSHRRQAVCENVLSSKE